MANNRQATDRARKLPAGLRRAVLRTPVHLYRMGLGGLLGRRFLLLDHRGRHSGLSRQAVLEIISHNDQTGEVIVASGWGTTANWYRNLHHAPALGVRVGRRRTLAPQHRFLDEGEALTVYAAFQQRHPITARLGARWAGLTYGTSEPAQARLVQAMPMVAFALDQPR